MNKTPIILSSRACILRSKAFTQSRPLSTKTARPTSYLEAQDQRPLNQQHNEAVSGNGESKNPLRRMSTSALIRNVFLGTVFTSPRLVSLSLPIMNRIANSQSLLASPERNPLVRFLVKTLVYDHFCAGTDRREVTQTRQMIKRQGYSGIILCCGQEVQVSPDNQLRSTSSAGEADEIRQWREGNIATVEMIGEGDWVGIKMTGAGTRVTQALMANEAPPADFLEAINEICALARAKKCRVWIDAEQQVLQTAIDRWTIDLMRRHNSATHATVYNTVQAYLKASRSKLAHQLALADREGWMLGIKLVRGAYIANDQRDKIHDCKQDTDDSYNGIVTDLLQGRGLGFPEHRFPKMQLFVAGHNPDTVRMAAALVQQLAAEGRLKVLPDFGQLQGMADSLGCELLEHCDERRATEGSRDGGGKVSDAVPKVYKCLTWGSVQECIQFLLRRMIENSGGSDRMRDSLSAYSAELRRRLLRSVLRSER